MNMKWIFAPMSLCASVILSMNGLTAAESSLNLQQEHSKFAPDLFFKYMLDKVHACVDYNQNIPYKEEVHQLINQLETCQYVSQTGTDDFKTKFLLAQGCIEHVLSCSHILGEITNLTGIVHMPMPAAPLCTNLEDPSLGDPLDISIAIDDDKLLTVRSRTQIARDYLAKGGILLVAYPKIGLEKKTPEQQKYYTRALEKYSDVLFDVPLECNAMDPNLIGATYAFKLNNQWCIFSMKARQAGTPQDVSEWALWFGKISQPIILTRVNTLCDFLLQNQGPDLKQFILKDKR
jgi:hypothetical protein